MEKCVFSSKRSNSLRGTCTVCCELMSSITGNSAAGRVDRLKRLRPALMTTFSPSTVNDTDNFLRQRPQNIQEFPPGTVISPAVLHRHFGGRHQLHLQIRGSDRQLPLAHASNTFANTGMVWRRSTTPMTACKGANNFSRSAVNFMGSPVSINLRSRFLKEIITMIMKQPIFVYNSNKHYI